MTILRRLLSLFLVFSFIFPALSPSMASAAVSDGSLIKNASNPAVYYVYKGKRYSFPNEKIYFSWYIDFGWVKTVSDGELASYPLAGNVMYKPGKQLIKIATDPKVYAVSRYGVLRWIASETTANKLYGPSWNTKVHDLSDAFFVDYLVGENINGGGDYIVFAESALTDVWQNIRPSTFVLNVPSQNMQPSPSPSNPSASTDNPQVTPSAPTTGAVDFNSTGGGSSGQVVNGHPKMWLTSADIPRLRSWATDVNPLYKDGLKPLIAKAVSNMDSGLVDQDKGHERTYEPYPREVYSMLFAFASLVDNDPAKRADYAARAKKLLMHIINEAVKGVAKDQPYRGPNFAVTDRAHFYGEAIPLTVDWIYPSLSEDDKAKIKQVFERWGGEIKNSMVTGEYAHPKPVGILNDPALLHLDDPYLFASSFSLNNHFTFHAKNIGMMGIAMDMEPLVQNAIGAWHYMTDYNMRHRLKGGFSAEGPQYAPTGLGSIVHLLLALHTAKEDNPSKYGPQAVLSGNPFWNDVVPAYLHLLSPGPMLIKNQEWMGPTYLPAWDGDGDKIWVENSSKLFGALGLYDYYTGNTKRLNAIRWIERNAHGGPSKLAYRMSSALSSSTSRTGILLFMLFDPTAPQESDPRPSLPLTWYGESLGRLLSRTSWTTDASWFTYKLGWIRIDHQHGDGNQIEFWRKGEPLTKDWVGYGPVSASSDYNNTLTIENDKPSGAAHVGGFQYIQWKHGSQWQYISSGDPAVLAKSFTTAYDYITGDATNLYNSTKDGATDVVYANRSVIWLKPDHIVIYDRAATKTDNRFKRFWLNMAAAPTIQGNQATTAAPKNQKLVVTTLLPTNASISSTDKKPDDAGWTETASGETMKYRLKVEDTSNPKSIRFLHVLQGADASAATHAATLIKSSSGMAYDGAVVNGSVVLFPVNFGESFSGVTYAVPSGTTKHYVTGLAPGAGYTITTQTTGGEIQVTISVGGSQKADAGGVLVF